MWTKVGALRFSVDLEWSEMENLSARFPQEPTGRDVRIVLRIFVECDSGIHLSLQRVGCKRRASHSTFQERDLKELMGRVTYMNIHDMSIQTNAQLVSSPSSQRGRPPSCECVFTVSPYKES